MAKNEAVAAQVIGTYGTMYHVKDMGKAVQFFTKSFGLKPSMESAEWTEFALGGQRLCLSAGGKETAPNSGILILQVEDLKAARTALKAGGVKVSEIGEVHKGAFACDFTDPEGHTVGLYQGPKSS